VQSLTATNNLQLTICYKKKPSKETLIDFSLNCINKVSSWSVLWSENTKWSEKQEEMKVKFKTCLKELFDLIYQKNLLGLKADILLPTANIQTSRKKAVYPKQHRRQTTSFR
jgi:hypothetical protein